MAPKNEKGSDEQQQPLETTEDGVPTLMLKHAQDVAASEQDPRSTTREEKRHMGHDVPMPKLQSHDTELFAENVPPPAYGEHYGAIHNEQDGLGTNASVADDGRVNIRIQQKSTKLSSLLVPALRHQQDISEQETPPPPPYIPPSLGGEEGVAPPPPLNIVIQVVGSRGDVQPFVALGKVLKETYGHRVRLATHPNFNDFVTENGLEFFSIGGDPAELMAFMVKNPGLMPGFDTLRSGDVGKRRKEVAEYIKGCWRSCYEAGDGLGAQATDDTIEEWQPRDPEDVDPSHMPFVADCIIANPPSFAHIHCAEKLGIPLHVMFTMPYSPTQSFPHPLANIQSSNADPKLANYMSYALIDTLTWQGLGDVINRFRQKSLGLEPISLMWAPGMLQRLKIPHTYCWSPALIPKPKDWGQHIAISGFYFLNLASNYTPAPDLQAFLDAGPPPVYIGFGSIVLDDPNAMTHLIFDAVKKSGQRVLLSKGWGGMGADEVGVPEGVFMLGNVPHDWLFKHVSCVVHHGGAGTTAAGITAGRPTLVVPFFGDQPFWGAMVARAGAGPEPIHHKQLTADNLAEAIAVCLKPESQERAQELADKIASERGSDKGAQSFHQYLNVDTIRCNLTPARAAVWRLKRTKLRLSAMAACTLATEGLLDFKDLKLFRAKEYETDDGPWDPVTGGATALVGTLSTMMLGVADFPIETLKALKIHPDSKKKKKNGDHADVTHSPLPQEHATGEKTPTGSIKTPSLSEATSGATSPDSSRTNSTFNFQESLARVNTPPTPGSLSSRSTMTMPGSMSEALSGQLTPKRSHSRSNSRHRSDNHDHHCHPNPVDTALGTGKGVSRIIGAGFNAPMEFTMGVAKGFHNAPKLYGDDTVRKSEQVTDFRSGVKAATKEFGYGMYDGITGLVTQPLKGAQKEGAAGFFKGIGKGIGGIALKPGAAIFGIPGYTMKGVYKELQKFSGSSVQNYIIAGRTAQGYDDWQKSSPEERQEVIQRWKSIQKDLKKKRNPDEMVRDILEEQRRKRQEHIAHWREKHPHHPHPHRSTSTGFFKKSHDMAGSHNASDSDLSSSTPGTPLTHSQSTPADYELHEAIKMSVQETSRGNHEEDAAVERAIQASMAELQKDRAARKTQSQSQEDEELRQAMAASEADMKLHPLEHDEELERALAQSLKEQRRKHGSDSEWDSEPDTEDDEEYKRAVKESQQHASSEQPPPYESSHALGQPQGDVKTKQEKTEEEIVMEYVKKQSLLEQQHQASSSKNKAPVTDEDDHELQQALKASMGHDAEKGEPSGTSAGPSS